jgi:hypothetical protein
MTPHLMATDGTRQAAEAVDFCQKLNAMVAATAAVKKKYNTACTRVHPTTALLEEEQRAVAILTEEARAVVALIEPPSPTPPPAPADHAAPSDDDYEATVIVNIHVQATAV